MSASIEHQILIEQRLSNDRKSAGIAYALWFFLGLFGAHRFYLGRTGSGVAMVILTILGIATAVFIVGMLIIGAVAIWSIVDAFLIPGWIESETKQRRRIITDELVLGKSAA